MCLEANDPLNARVTMGASYGMKWVTSGVRIGTNLYAASLKICVAVALIPAI